MPARTNKWAYGIAALALGLVAFLGFDIVGTEDELQQVKEPLAVECVTNGFVFNALRQTCEQIVDGDTPNEDVPVAPPGFPVERFPRAPATPVPNTVILPGEPISEPPNAPTVLTLPPAASLPQETVTLAAPPPETVTLPAPPAQTETVTLAAPPPETVTQPAPPPETVTVTQPPETVTETEPAPPPVTETVTETTGPPPIIGVN